MAARKFMFVNRKGPGDGFHGLELQEAAVMAAAFEQDVSVVYMDEGVLLLKMGHQMDDDNDVDKLYVERESLDAYGLRVEDLSPSVVVLSATELGALMEQQDVILSA